MWFRTGVPLKREILVPFKEGDRGRYCCARHCKSWQCRSFWWQDAVAKTKKILSANSEADHTGLPAITCKNMDNHNHA